jgi:hypothetical protein
MPGLQVLQDKYGKTGKFTVIGSYVQSFNDTVTKFLNDNKITFPHYNQLHLTKAPCGNGIPYMVLLNHKGDILKSGHITHDELEKLIADAVKEAPGSGPSGALYADVEVNHFRKDVAGLVIGKSVKNTLQTLERKSTEDNEQGKEAKALVDAVNKWGKTELEECTKLKDTKPSEAYERFELLYRTFMGMPLVEAVPGYIAELKKDKYVVYMVNLGKQYNSLKASNKVDKRSKDNLIRNYQAFIDKYPASEALKAEAAEYIKKIEAL